MVLRVCLKQCEKSPTPTEEKIHIEGGENAKFTGKDKRCLKVGMEKLQANIQMYEAAIQQNT